MKLTAILLFVVCLQVSATGYSQNDVTISVNNVKLKKFLHILQKNTPYRFLYEDGQLPSDIKVNLNANKVSIQTLLDEALRNTPLRYQVLNNNLVVLSKADLFTVQNIKGKVTDENGQPLTGVTIKSGKNITVSDAQGNFSIDAERGDTIEFSYVGYATQTIKVGAQTSIDIVMQAGENKLDEIVVVGYNTQSRRNLTSAVVTVSGEDIKECRLIRQLFYRGNYRDCRWCRILVSPAMKV